MLKKLAVIACLATTAAQAAELSIAVTIPSHQVAEYHRPYVAIWLENRTKKVSHLGLWYDTEMRNNEGQKWLKDLRKWWRRGGRKLTLPADGISGASRKPGSYKLHFSDKSPAFSALAPGKYKLHVEASREVGGREVVSIPFTWPIGQTQTQTVDGSNELSTVSLTVTP